MPFHFFKLTNGLRVQCSPRPGTGLAGLAIGLPVGASADPRGKCGLAHLVEHVAVTSIRRWSENQLRDEVELRGAEYNACTTHWTTVYEIVVPAKEIDFGLEYLQQVVFEPAFLPDLIDREKSIVTAEAERDQGELASKISNFLSLFKLKKKLLSGVVHSLLMASPRLDRSLIGYPKDRRRISAADLYDFHALHYRPDRATLFVLGDVEPMMVAEYAQARLGSMPGQPQAGADPYPAAGPRKRRHRYWNSTPEEIMLVADAFCLPDAQPDLAATYLLANVIGYELFSRLRTKRGLVYQVSANVDFRPVRSALVIQTEVRHRYLAELTRTMNQLYDELERGVVDRDVFERVRRTARGIWLRRSSVLMAYLEWLVEWPGAFEDKPLPDLVTDLDDVTLDRVADAARRVIRSDTRLSVIQDPSHVLTVLAWSFGIPPFVHIWP